MRKWSLILIYLFIIISYSKSQVGEILPNGPTTSELNKVGSTNNRSLYTGTPQISIPLLNLDMGGFKFPINLSYSYNGLLPQQKIPNNVGLGWNISASGYIARTIQGLADDINVSKARIASDYVKRSNAGFLKEGGDVANDMFDHDFSSWDWDSNRLKNEISYASHSSLDLSPDRFIVKIGDLINCEFYFDNEGEIKVVGGLNYKIIPELDADNETLTAFKLLDNNGNMYIFNLAISSKGFVNTRSVRRDIDGSKDIYYNPFISNDYETFCETATDDEGRCWGNTPLDFTNIWYLTKIIQKNSKEINFEYPHSANFIKYSINLSLNTRFSLDNNGDLRTELYEADHEEFITAKYFGRGSLLPKRISWDNGEILFGYRESHMLDLQYIFYQIKDETCMGWEFNNGEFQSEDNQADIENLNLGGVPSSFWRKLESISFFSGKGLSEKNYLEGFSKYNFYTKEYSEKYNFTYFENHLFPSSHTMELDYWGYYNNNNSNTLYPKIYKITDDSDINAPSQYSFYKLFNNNESSLGILYNGADRSANEEYTKLGMIKSVTYPTGGYKLYEYKGNTFQAYGRTVEGGGVRVNKISTFESVDDSNPKVISYDYIDPETSATSGKICALPVFTQYKGNTISISNFNINGYMHGWGNIVNYTYVKESLGANLGEIEYKFDIPGSIEDNDIIVNGTETLLSRPVACNQNGDIIENLQSNRYIPFPNLNWLRGSLLQKTIFDNNDNPIQKEDYEYQYIIDDTIKSIFVRNEFKSKPSCTDCHGAGIWDYHVYTTVTNRYTVYSLTTFATKGYIGGNLIVKNPIPIGKKQISKKTVIDYIRNLETETSYKYNSNNQVKEINKLKSNGSFLTSIYKYPLDYNLDPDEFMEYHDSYNRALYGLINSNNISTPIEAVVMNKTGSTAKVTSGKVNLYKVENLSDPIEDWRVNLASVQQLDILSPIAYNSSVFDSKISAVDPVYDYIFEYNSNYETSVLFDKYDTYGNLLQYHKENDINTSYIWGYNNTYPIAKIENATRDYFAYASFESDCPNDWSLGNGSNYHDEGKTGTESLEIGVDLETKEVLPAGKYLLSFYAKYLPGGSGYLNLRPASSPITGFSSEWKFFTRTITISSSQKIALESAGGIVVDELRLHLVDAYMSTYTYNPLIGITSETDPDGRTTYYEYDDFGRLKYIINHKGEVVKKSDYHYAN